MLEGTVEIPLGAGLVTLEPTLGAALELCRRHQSFGALLAKLEAYDLPACVDVVQVARGGGASERRAFEELVFENGVVTLAPLLIRFVIMLANGGRPLTDAEEEADATRPFGE